MRPQIVRLSADIVCFQEVNGQERPNEPRSLLGRGLLHILDETDVAGLEVRRLIDQILDTDPDAQIVVAGDFNAAPDEVPVTAIRGEVENTGNADLVGRVLVPIEHTIPAAARYTFYHQGHGEMLDHLLVTRNLLAHYRGSEIHNEIRHDESAAFANRPEIS